MIFTYRTRAYSTDCWTGNAFQLRTRYLLVFAGLCIRFFLVSWSLSLALSLAWLHWPFVHRCGLCQITESHTYVRCVRARARRGDANAELISPRQPCFGIVCVVVCHVAMTVMAMTLSTINHSRWLIGHTAWVESLCLPPIRCGLTVRNYQLCCSSQ